jgi:hypothetical protein
MKEKTVTNIFAFLCLGLFVGGFAWASFSRAGDEITPYVIAGYVIGGVGFIGFVILMAVTSDKKAGHFSGRINDSSEGYEGAGAEKPKAKEAGKVRCPHCGQLNDEDATYCQNCGNRLR